MQIKICGPGCAACDATKKNVEAAVSAKSIEATIVQISDFQEMAQMGVFSTPAVIVDDEVKCVGRTPKQEEIEQWIR